MPSSTNRSNKSEKIQESFYCKNTNCNSKNIIYVTKMAKHHDESDMKFIKCLDCDYNYVL